MGSKTNTRNKLAVSRNRAWCAIRFGDAGKVKPEHFRVVRSFPKRHKCVACGTGGHRRVTPRTALHGAFEAERA